MTPFRPQITKRFIQSGLGGWMIQEIFMAIIRIYSAMQ